MRKPPAGVRWSPGVSPRNRVDRSLRSAPFKRFRSIQRLGSGRSGHASVEHVRHQLYVARDARTGANALIKVLTKPGLVYEHNLTNEIAALSAINLGEASIRVVPSLPISSTGSGCSLTQRRRGLSPRSVTPQAPSVTPCGACTSDKRHTASTRRLPSEMLEAAAFVSRDWRTLTNRRSTLPRIFRGSPSSADAAPRLTASVRVSATASKVLGFGRSRRAESPVRISDRNLVSG